MADQVKTDHDLLVEMHTMMQSQVQIFRDHVQTFKEHVLEDDQREIATRVVLKETATSLSDLRHSIGQVSLKVGLIVGGCVMALNWLGQWGLKAMNH